MTPTITTFAWVPKFARGQVRDLRARWAFEEIGERYTVDLIRDAKTPEYRRLQPFGQVPTYRDDGVALFESGAIVLHIARRGAGLLPDDAAGRAIAEQWVIAALNSVEPAVMDLVRCDLFEADKPWSAQRRPSVLETARARLGGVATALGDQPYLAGDAFYRHIFHWSYPDVMPMGPIGEYRFIAVGEQTFGATMRHSGEAQHPGWRFYFRAPDIEAAVVRVAEAGGSVLSGPMDVPGGDRIIVASDPHGVVFGVVGPGATG